MSPTLVPDTVDHQGLKTMALSTTASHATSPEGTESHPHPTGTVAAAANKQDAASLPAPIHSHENANPIPTEIATNPVFHPSRPTKILISPGSGAGWVSWAPRGSSDAFLVWMVTYEPLIRGLEKREHKEKLEELLSQFHKEAHARFGVESIVTARTTNLVVCEVHDPFEVRETEGEETLVDVGRRRSIGM